MVFLFYICNINKTNMEYRLKEVLDMWEVWSGHISYHDFVPEKMVYVGRLADAMSWIEAKKQGLFI